MKQYRVIIVFLTASMLFFTTTSFGWGRTGHHIVAEIAASIMNEHAKENVQSYFNH